jgi:YggT family protein
MGQISAIVFSLINFYSILVFVWVVLSWFQNTKSKLVKEIYKVLDTVVAPYVNLFRKMLPTMGGLDFSPFVALIVLQIIARSIYALLG